LVFGVNLLDFEDLKLLLLVAKMWTRRGQLRGDCGHFAGGNCRAFSPWHIEGIRYLGLLHPSGQRTPAGDPDAPQANYGSRRWR
jgi:hypothetical protein